MPSKRIALDNTLHALADPTRRMVLQRLSHGSASVSELASPFPMSLPSFMRHITILEASGLVKSKKIGRTRICDFQPNKLTPVEIWITTQKTTSSHRKAGRLKTIET